MAWTRFMDMHTNGEQKTRHAYIYIQAPMERAIECFKALFKRDPYDSACRCCGQDYSIDEESGPIAQVTAYERNCAFDNTLRQYVEKTSEYACRKHSTVEQHLRGGRKARAIKAKTVRKILRSVA